MKIGFIGCGNMATAVIKGIVVSNNVKSKDIYIYDIFSPAAEKAVTNYSVTQCESEQDVVKNSDIIFLAVKPNVLESVLDKISNFTEGKVIISIAAGKTIEFISDKLNKNTKIIRVMPNINAKVGEAISAYCANEFVNDDEKKELAEILNLIGKSMELDEKFFSVFGVIGGCAPAFVYMFIDALAREGVKNGIRKDIALKIAAQTVYGSAKMILESESHPWELIDNVCSPGGTTVEGVISLQSDGFEKAVHNAVEKAIEKDKKL